MHDIVLIGLNHKTAPVELRECIAFSEEEAVTPLEALRDRPIDESLIFSTCNRVEVLLVTAETPEPSRSPNASSPNTTGSLSNSLKMPSTFTGTTKRCAMSSGWPRASTP